MYMKKGWLIKMGSSEKVRSQVKINTIFQRRIVNIFLPISFTICFGCTKEPSH